MSALQVVVFVMALAGSVLVHAGEGSATAEQAVAMVQRGVVHLKAHGAQRGYADITRRDTSFKDRDLYLVVYGLDGQVRAHGAQPKLVGKNLLEVRDVDGRAFVRERVELARVKASFWQDYKFINPVSRRVEPKRMYCERLDDSVVCGGIYLK